ncbi:MAG TPA: hypothetical protein VMU80_28050 [Bryobacteraceae bacterium]|nr:hypothetical protein [Bryobacteraceae bacterium]HUO33100.1 hypothetical protein [Bryobacteraceae bacterium]
MRNNGIRSKILKSSLQPIARLLKTGEEHATIDRLFESRHVQDIQVIIAISCIAVFLTSCAGVGIAIWKVWDNTWMLYVAIATCLKYGAPVLVVFGSVVGWAYKTGSARLGVVDLFACEISTLCRVTKVVETVNGCLHRIDHPPAEHLNSDKRHLHGVEQFTSEENYFPVFASNNQALQALEATVVINITSFYTYMKAFRDSLRALAQISMTAEMNDSPARATWRTAAGNSVYMLFLALESARKAITDLVEFEPERAERTIVILLSELEAFRFLRAKYFRNKNIYHKRIELRVPEYERVVPPLAELVSQKADGESLEAANWEPADLLVGELRTRYEEAVEHFKIHSHEQSIGAPA